MSQYTSFGYDWFSAGHQLWAFVFPSDASTAAYDPANSNSGKLVYNNSDGTRTWVNGSGLSVDGVGGIHWTTLTSLEHRAADGTLFERIDSLGTVGANPGSSSSSQLGAALLAGIDTVTGSAGRDAMTGSEGADTISGGAGADSLGGGGGDDIIRLAAGDFVAGEQISGDRSGTDHGVDTLQLENVGNLDLRIGSVGGIDTVNFFSGTSVLTLASPTVGGLDQFKTFIGSAGVDALIIAGAGNLSAVTFTNWTAGQDTITILAGGGNFGTVFGSAKNDTIIVDGAIIGSPSIEANDGDDTIVYSGPSSPVTTNGGNGTDTIKLQGGAYDFSGITLTSVEQLAFDTGTSTATFSMAELNAGVVPAITGSVNVDAVVIAGSTTINSSTLVLNSWTEGVDTLTLTDIGNGVATSFTGSSHRETINANNGSDTLNGKGGADQLFGGAAADKFVFDSVALSDAQSAIFDRVRDYNQGNGAYEPAEGDQVDLSTLLGAAYNHGSGQAVSSLVRAVEDASGTFANLQIDTDGAANGANFITIARLDGIQVGNPVNVILDATLPGGSSVSVTAAVAGSISINDVSISEGDSGTKVETFTVTRSGGTAAFDINYATADNSATAADADYVAKSGTLHFDANINTQTISVTINGDAKFESDEAFLINLSGATSGATISDGQGLGTITNDDPSVFAQPTFQLAAFAPGAGGWNSENTYPRELADVNNDGMADIVAFGQSGVFVSLATGGGAFGTPTLQLGSFGPNSGGWTSQDQYPRELADVNGDHMADIVAFGQSGVFVSLATGGGSFGTPTFKLAGFGPSAGGWTSQNQFPRELADVNGDHMADIVAFGQTGVFVSLATGGGSFGTPTFQLSGYGPGAGGWTSQDQFPRELADVNNDGMADIVAFGQTGVFVSLATGGGGFGTPTFKLAGFGPGAGGWTSQDQFPRELADANGDGNIDIVAFGQSGVFLSLGNGDGSFQPVIADLHTFGSAVGGWTSQDAYPRLLADVNHDGAADIIGFGQNGVYEALSNNFHLI